MLTIGQVKLEQQLLEQQQSSIMPNSQSMSLDAEALMNPIFGLPIPSPPLSTFGNTEIGTNDPFSKDSPACFFISDLYRADLYVVLGKLSDEYKTKMLQRSSLF